MPAAQTNVLVVIDDDSSFVSRVTSSASTLGWTALAYRSFADGFEAILRNRPARLIVEPFLPHGYELVRVLAAVRAQIPAIRVYAVSAYPSVAMALQLVRSRAVVDYLIKPVPVPVLATAWLSEQQPAEDAPRLGPESLPSLARIDWEYITWVLTRCSGNISVAASVLGVSRNTLHRRLKKYPPAR
jgi:two-component system, response regulator RegA